MKPEQVRKGMRLGKWQMQRGLEDANTYFVASIILIQASRWTRVDVFGERIIDSLAIFVSHG